MVTGPRQNVLYIMGTGRSGSTLLGITLDSVPGVFYGGELFAWNHFQGVPISDDASLLRFWEDVGRGIAEPDRAFDHDFYRELEHPRSLFTSPRRRRQSHPPHHAHNAALFRRIGEVTDASVVVDSSHFPLRALLLRRNPALDVHVVHLVRDPRTVINALQNDEQRAVPMRPWIANAYCWAVAVLSGLALLRFPSDKRVTIRYEDLVVDPQCVVDRVCALLGLPTSRCDFDRLPVGKIFQGNRLRHRTSVAISPQPHVPRLPPVWRAATAVLQAPLLAAYGYIGMRRRDGLT